MMPLVSKIQNAMFGRSKRLVAIDFDSRHIRIVLAEVSSQKARIRSASSIPVPEEVDVADGEALGNFLGQKLRDMRCRGIGLLMNVPRSQVVLKPLSLPGSTPPEELASMVQYQVGGDLPFPVDQAVMDFTVERRANEESDKAEELNILVAAIRRSVVDYYRQVADVAGSKLLSLGLRPNANMCCVRAGAVASEQDSLAVVQITADETEIDLVSKESLAFSRAAVQDMGALDGLDEPTVRAGVNSLVMEVARSVHSYQAVERGVKIEAVLLAGETGMESRAAEQLASRLRVSCKMLKPEQIFGPLKSGPVSSAFISALGLAVGFARSGGLDFDFVNPKRPPAKRNVERRRAVAVAAGVLVLLISSVVARSVVLGRMSGELAVLRRANNKLDDEIKAAKAEASRVEAMEQWLAGSHNWLDYWAHMSCLLPSAQEVYLTGLRATETGEIRFTVKARSSQAITDFNKKLEEAGYKFEPGQVKTGNDPYDYVYSTTVRLTVPPDTQFDLEKIKPVARPGNDCTPQQFVAAVNPGGSRRSR